MSYRETAKTCKLLCLEDFRKVTLELETPYTKRPHITSDYTCF